MGTRSLVARFIARSTNCRGRYVNAALREAKKREPRFRSLATLARGTVRLLGFGELTAQSMKLRQFVERQSSAGLMRGFRESFAGAHRFADRVVPDASHLEHFGSAHEALAA